MALFEEVKDVIVAKLGSDPDAINLETRFIEDLGADSLEVVELVMGLEDAFSINISDEDAEKIRTVQDAIDYISSARNTSS